MDNKNQRRSEFAKYSSMGIQMVAIIGIFVYAGNRLDKNNEAEKPWFTLAFSLFGVIIAMIYMIRTVTRGDKK